MELAHLVRAVSGARSALPAWRLLARFFCIGALLFAARQVVHALEPVRRPLTVEVPADASDALVASTVDEAILFDFAVRAGWHRTDLIVRERLVGALALAGEVETEPRVAMDRAVALGLHARDPIARRRLVETALRALEHVGEERAPTAEEIRAQIEAHPDAYRSPGRVRFHQVFLSRERRGSDVDAAAVDVGTRILADTGAPSAETLALSDPWPWSSTVAGESPERLSALFGEGFGQAVATAQPGKWEGPFRSSFGVHFVWVEERVEPALPPLAAVTEPARAAIAAERRAGMRAERMESLRREYQITISRVE